MIKRFFILFLFGFYTCVFSFTLKDRLMQAKVGDYIVTKQKNLYTLLFIREKKPDILVLEEISSNIFNKEFYKKKKWQEWVNQKAPGHSSWLIFDIDTKSFRLLQCYSVVEKAYLPIDEIENFFIRLTNLPLKYLEENQRERIGSYDLKNALWTPPFTYEGKNVKTTFSVYQVSLPKNFPYIASKTLQMYFDDKNLSFFPTWLQLKGNLSFMIHQIDAGKNLSSSIPSYPHLLPKFHPGIQENKNSIVLSMEKSYYYKEFDLFAIDVNVRPKKIHSLTFSFFNEKDHNLFIIEKKHLKTCLTKNHRYFFLVSPKKEKNNYIEFPKIYIYKD